MKSKFINFSKLFKKQFAIILVAFWIFLFFFRPDSIMKEIEGGAFWTGTLVLVSGMTILFAIGVLPINKNSKK